LAAPIGVRQRDRGAVPTAAHFGLNLDRSSIDRVLDPIGSTTRSRCACVCIEDVRSSAHIVPNPAQPFGMSSLTRKIALRYRQALLSTTTVA
jgi:hypothetical protein